MKKFKLMALLLVSMLSINLWGADETLTITGANSGHNAPWGTSYGNGTGTSKTSDNTSISISYTQVARMSTTIQIAKNTDNGFYSTSCPTGKAISSVTLNVKTNSATLTLSKDGTTWSSPSSYTEADGYKYFKVNATSKYTQITSIVVTYKAVSSYTVTAVANNESYGTVALSGSTITATPKSGYRVKSGTAGYTVTSGTATVTNNEDNTFTVTPSTNCTVQINFEEKGCTDHGGSNVTSGTSTSYGPVDPYYKYSTRQILYTKTDLGLAAGKKGTIKSIYFEYASSTAMAKKTNVTIYMANTNLTALSTSDYVPFSSFTEVYSGALNCTQGWNEISLATPFVYNGSGSLVVLIDDNSNAYDGSDYKFKYHTANGAQIYKRNDDTNEDPSSTDWSSYTETNNRPNTKFCIEEADMTTATVTWYVNSVSKHSQTDYPGTICTAPTTPTTSDCDGSKVFVGWTATQNYESVDTAPSDLFTDPTTKTIPDGGANYYAVFANESISGKGIDEVVDNSFTGSYEGYCSMTYGLKTAGTSYVQKNSIWSGLTAETIKLNIKHISNTKADILTVSLIDNAGNNVVSTDVTTQTISSSKDDASYLTNSISLTATSAVTGYKIKLKTKNGYGTCIGEVSRVVEAAITRTNYATTCAPIFNISSSITGQGSILWSLDLENWSATIANQPENTGIYFKLVPTSGWEIDGKPSLSTGGEVTDMEYDNIYGFEMPASAVTVSASFKQPATYMILYDLGNFTDATGDLPDPEEVAPGTNYSVNTTNKLSLTGYTFKGWNTDKNATTGLTNITVNDDITLYAIFTINSYNVTFNPSITGGSIKVNGSSTSPVQVEYNSEVTIIVTPTTHFNLSTLTYNSTDIKTAESFKMPAENVEIAYSFTEDPKVTVTFKNNGETLTTDGTREVYVNDPIGTLPTLTSSDAEDARSKTFVGWTTAKLTNWQPEAPELVSASTTVTEALELNAVWAKKGEGGTYTNQYKKITSTADFTDGDYMIVGSYSESYNYALNSDVESTNFLKATSVNIDNNTINNTNNKLIWTATKKSGDETKISLRNVSNGNYLSIVTYTSSNKTYYNLKANSSDIKYFTYSVNNGVWKFVSTDYAYQVIYTYYSSSYTDEFTTLASNETPEYDLYLFKRQRNISYSDYITHSSSSPLESITLNTDKVKENYFVGEDFTSADLSATAKLGDGTTFPIEYKDLVITPADLSTAGVKTVTVTYTFNDATKSNTYTVNAYSVTINSVYTDRVNDESVDGNTYTWTPTTGALTFSTQTHYQFNGITSEIVGVTLNGTKPNYTLSNPTANVTLTATWQRLFTLTYNGKGGSTPTAVADKTKGTSITLSTSSRTGYNFEGWYDNEAYEGTALTSPYTINADATIFAKWSEIMPTEIKVSSSEVSLIVDGSSSEQKTTITATVEPSTALNKNIAWSVVEGADVVSVSSEGLITALKAGSAKVKVTSTRDANVYKEIPVTVHALPQITWKNMDGSTYASTNGTSAGKVGALPTGTPNSCDAETYPYFRGWSATNFGKTTDNPEADFITVNTPVELDKKYTFHAVCAAGKEEIQTVFTETFDQCEGTGGNDDQWSGSIASSTLTTDNTGWTYSSGNGGSKCAKFGGSSSKGSAETPSITMSGDGTIILKAAAWNTSDEKTTLNISTTSGTVNPTSVTLKKAKWSEYEISITGVTTATKIKFEANAKNSNRFFIDNVVVKANAITYTTWATQCCTSPNEDLAIIPIASFKKGQKATLQTTGGNGNDVTWSASNGAVTINPTTGEIEGIVTGDVVITAHQDPKDDFCEQTAIYNLSVISASEYGILIHQVTGGAAEAKNKADVTITKAEKDDEIKVVATPADDYNFTGWTVNAGGVTLADASKATTTFAMGEADVEITPSFAIKQYMVTLDAGTGTVETDSYTEDAHTQVTLPAAAHCQSDVWVFQGWSETNLTAAASKCPALVDNNYEITKDVTLYAIYKKADGGEKTIGYKISYQVSNTTYYASSGVTDQKMGVSTDADDAIVFGITTTSGQSKLYQVDENGDAKSGTYIYLDSNDKLDQGAENSSDGYLWTISMTGTHSIINVKKNTRCIAGRSGDAGANVVNASTTNVDGSAVSGNYFHHITLVPVVKGAASYHTSPECVSLTWVNGMSADEQFVTYPSAEGKIVLPTETPTSCAPGLYSFVGWTATEIPTYKTSQQEIVTAEMAAPEHATAYYAEFVNTAGNRYRTTCPDPLYAITYHANDGTDANYVAYTELTTSTTPTAEQAGFVKEGATLIGWTLDPNAEEIVYVAPGTELTGIDGNREYYAVWVGSIQMSAPVRLTSAKGATAGSAIFTLSSQDLGTITTLRFSYKDVDNNITYSSSNRSSSEFRLCNTNYTLTNAENNVDVTTSGVNFSKEYAIVYTPNSENKMSHYQLVVELMVKSKVMATNTFDLYGRSLPDQFVIAESRDNKWYALPANINDEAKARAGVEITVSGEGLNMGAVVSENELYTLKTYNFDKNKVLFQSVANNGHLWAASGDGTGIRNYAATISGENKSYAWILTPKDETLLTYTLGNVNNSRTLAMYGTNFGMYATYGTNTVYFLPLKTITEKIEVNNEQMVSLSDYEVDETTTVIVHAGGILNADKQATVGTLQIEKADGKSGQIIETENLTANNAYFDLTINASGMKWYDIAVPFTVDRLHGLSFPNGGSFPLNDVLVYNGATRAQNGANGSAWQYQDDGDLVPGVGYDIMFATNVTTVRFTKKAEAQLNNEEDGSIIVEEFESQTGSDMDANWNYIANNTLHYVNLGFNDSQNSGVLAQTYNPENDSYIAYAQDKATYLIGTPFFVQVAAEDFVVWGTTPIHDVLRAPAMTMNRVDRFTLEMSANGEMTDRLFVSADENARDEYQIGKDVAKMGVSTTVAQMWINNYNTKLCANEAVLTNGQATYQLGVFVPKDGEYTIAITSAPENATLYLTIDGQVVWNLSESAYVANLTKGTHNEFGLLLIANEKVTPTNINGLKGNNKAQKIFKDYNIYILRDAQMYNTQGVKVQ